MSRFVSNALWISLYVLGEVKQRSGITNQRAESMEKFIPQNLTSELRPLTSALVQRSTIEDRFFEIIIKATKLKEQISDNLCKNDEFVYMINDLKELLSSTRRERYESGMAEICADCGTSGKDCCGRGIEFKYSKELLIINMFMGAEIPSKRLLENSCYFLTEKGCSLLVRHVFCVNFLCQKIRDKVSFDRLKRLQELEGRELELSFRLEEFIKKHLKNHSNL